jgi:hypothetical protein
MKLILGCPEIVIILSKFFSLHLLNSCCFAITLEGRIVEDAKDHICYPHNCNWCKRVNTNVSSSVGISRNIIVHLLVHRSDNVLDTSHDKHGGICSIELHCVAGCLMKIGSAFYVMSFESKLISFTFLFLSRKQRRRA